jgi:hypothetical protein
MLLLLVPGTKWTSAQFKTCHYRLKRASAVNPIFHRLSDRHGIRYHGTDNYGAGVNSLGSTMRDFRAAAVVTTYL